MMNLKFKIITAMLNLKRALRFLKVNNSCANFRIFPPFQLMRIDAHSTSRHLSKNPGDGIRIRNDNNSKNYAHFKYEIADIKVPRS